MDTENSSHTGNTIDYITLGICERCGTEIDSYGCCACEHYSKPILAKARLKALDLFAGTGWGVACKRLGITESGVENMPEAVATRTANGMRTAYLDVWDGLALTSDEHRAQYGGYGMLIASPPCQTFSMAGHGKGRAALDEVLEAIDLHAYKDAAALRDFGERHDMRTALVLAPLAYVWRDRPRIVVLEQVPTVLPVWEACAEVMREWGYDVKVEVLNAEQYGVPQTRKRAILVARRGGPIHLPVPTHSRYYSNNPSKLDPGVKKWVSMAEALGWTRQDPAEQIFCPTNLRPHSGFRAGDLPASSLAFGHDRPRWLTAEEVSEYRENGTPADGIKLSPEEAATIQSYPSMLRSNYGSGGDASNRGERTADQPAPTLTSKADRNKWDGDRNMTAEEAAALQTYPTHIAASGTTSMAVDPRPVTSPAPTITGAANAEWGTRSTRAATRGDRDPNGVRLNVEESAALQTYEPPFVWCGTKTKQFLQIGNAVPPLLAEAVLAAAVGITPGR